MLSEETIPHHKLTSLKLFAASLSYRCSSKASVMSSSNRWYEQHPLGFPPSTAPSLDYYRLPSHLGKSSKLVCTRFGVSYLDILDFCFLEYHNVILTFRILAGDRLLSFMSSFFTSKH